MSAINFNGSLADSRQPLLSVHNRAFKYGDGFFETMRMISGTIPLFRYHFKRIRASMQMLSLENHIILDHEKLSVEIRKLTSYCAITNGIIRIGVYRAGGGMYTPETDQADFVIEAMPHDSDHFELNTSGLNVGTYPDYKKPINKIANLKSSNALSSVLAANWAKKNNFNDAFILNTASRLSEATSSNVFLVHEGRLYTPSLIEGCVDGVMRRAIMDIAEKRGTIVVEREIIPFHLNEADEIMLTNAVQGIRWVRHFNDRKYGFDFCRQVVGWLNHHLVPQSQM